MDWTTYLDHIRHDGDLLARAGEKGLDADAPCCPGWTVQDVIAHTGVVHRHKARIIAERLADNPDPEEAPRQDLVAWYRAGLATLLDTLAGIDPGEPVFTWHPSDQTAGFWYRRMAQETLIHRVDAEQGHGLASPIDAELAADGIDEVLTMYVGGHPDWGTFRVDGRTLRIECLDREAGWTIHFGKFSGTSPKTGNTFEDLPAFEVGRRVDEPDSVIAGHAADLDLWLWGRGPLDPISVSGDMELVQDLRRLCAEEMV